MEHARRIVMFNWLTADGYFEGWYQAFIICLLVERLKQEGSNQNTKA
jgi:hypothetical protein